MRAVDAELIALAWQLGERYRVSCWDSFIVAAAQRAGCDLLYSEDMQPGMIFDGGLRIVNPFAEGAELGTTFSVQEPRATYAARPRVRPSRPVRTAS